MQVSYAILDAAEMVGVAIDLSERKKEAFCPDEYILSNFGSAENFFDFRRELDLQLALRN